MKYSTDLSTSGGRLATLFIENGYRINDDGYKSQLKRAILDMYKMGILKYNEPQIKDYSDKKMVKRLTEERHEKDISYSYNQIRLQLNNEREIAATWIKRYCLFFNCPADYLLGLSDKTLSSYGLGPMAIKNLRALNERDMELLNHLLIINRGLSFHLILQAIYNFLNPNYHIPIWHKTKSQGKGYRINQGIIPDHDLDVFINEDGEKDYLLTLLSDDLDENDSLRYVIDESFVEDISLKGIEKSIISFKRKYQSYKERHKKAAAE